MPLNMSLTFFVNQATRYRTLGSKASKCHDNDDNKGKKIIYIKVS